MSVGSILTWALASFGWALVLTKGAGPWNALEKLRAAWKGGPLRCPMCVGVWIGLAASLLSLLAAHSPRAEAALFILESIGASTGAAWLLSHVADLARHTAELQRQRAKGYSFPCCHRSAEHDQAAELAQRPEAPPPAP